MVVKAARTADLRDRPMSDIVLSQGVRSNLLSLQRNADQLGLTQNRLATGRKVNTALDNPTNYFVSSGLQSRAKDLQRLLDGIGQSTKTLEAADNGIKGMLRLIETAQGTLRQAFQAAGTTARVVSLNAYSAGSGTLLTSTPPGLAAGNTIQVGVSGTPAVAAYTFTVAAASTLGDLVNGINTALPGRARASLNDAGNITIESLVGQATAGASQDLTVTANSSAVADALFGVGVFPTATATTTQTGTLSVTRTKIADTFNQLLDQVDTLAQDSSYNGVNLLQAQSLRVVFNEDDTTGLLLKGVLIDQGTLGLTRGYDATVIPPGQSRLFFQSDENVRTALSQLDTAAKTLRAQATTFGSNNTIVIARQEFTKQAILTLNTGADQLILADTNEEGANLLALQTRQSLSIQALSLASQSDQAVLRLFG
jgi:flagellin